MLALKLIHVSKRGHRPISPKSVDGLQKWDFTRDNEAQWFIIKFNNRNVSKNGPDKSGCKYLDRLFMLVHPQNVEMIYQESLPFLISGIQMCTFWLPDMEVIYNLTLYISCQIYLVRNPSHIREIHNCVLTHWGRVTHIFVSKLTIIGSDNGLSPGRRQAIIWINAGILLIGPLGTNFIEIYIEILTFAFKEIC